MDGKEVEDDVGVWCRKRGVEDNNKFEASAIGRWLELWQLILVLVRREPVLFVYRNCEHERYIYGFELYSLEAVKRRWRQVVPSHGLGLT